MMEDVPDGIEVAGFYFTANFDSANLARVELVPKKPVSVPVIANIVKKPAAPAAQRPPAKPPKPAPVIEVPDFEFNIWTNPDCCGTQFENSNRTWFHFGVRGGPPFSLVKFNIVDLNKQGRMYRDGMAPVFRVCPGRPWERVRDKPIYNVDDNVFTLSFKYRTLESPKSTLYFAFTYPFSYTDLQNHLATIDSRMGKPESLIPKTDVRFTKGLKLVNESDDTVYYNREVVCHTLEGRRVDLITISSHHNITTECEPRLPHLFPDDSVPRCLKFRDKKVIFMSARVHPGETPSSFVLNGLLNLLVSRDDPVALLLRRQFVFKLIPMLNPDGVARGHYRTDTRGANLNRFYLRPDFRLHPSIFAARSLIRYYHYGQLVPDDGLDSLGTETVSPSDGTSSPDGMTSSMETLPMQDLSIKSSNSSLSSEPVTVPTVLPPCPLKAHCAHTDGTKTPIAAEASSFESGLFLYMDMHGHASKKGIFMYGNHFDRSEDSVDCMLFPKLMSINSQNFHFGACNFTERNMYLRDKRDGTSREGSGRVAVLRLTGLVRSYTLECNYNTGRVVNAIPQCSRELPGRPNQNLLSPPKYNPAVYEEVGRAIGVSILDLTNSNPWSRIPNSEHHTIVGVREWLRLKATSETSMFPRSSTAAPRAKRNSQVIISLRPPRPTGKGSAGVRLSPLPGKSLDAGGDWENKEAPLVPSKRPGLLRTTAVRSICAKNLRPGDKPMKMKLMHRSAEEADAEKKVAMSTVSLGLNCPDAPIKTQIPVLGEPSSFKQCPKRLKMCKGEGDASRLKKPEWKKDMSADGTSDLALFSKPSRSPSTSADPCVSPAGKKRVLKPKIQPSPLKFKKSLEKRRNSDKKKILYKKASKLALSSSELSKADRKRRNVLP